MNLWVVPLETQYREMEEGTHMEKDLPIHMMRDHTKI
jgi:hypothetical protein